MKKILSALILIGFGCLAVATIALFYYLFHANSSDSSTKIILIEHGSFKKTAELLEHEGLISHPRRFAIAATLLRQQKVKVGEYEVRKDMTPYQILRILSSGISIPHEVHIPEGFNVDQVADALVAEKLVDREKFLKLVHDPKFAESLGVHENSLEGYLFPETYSFTHFTGEKAILKTMVEKFKDVYESGIKAEAEKAKIPLHDLVVLASMIEKETGAPEERPIISSVFKNRLRLKMKLQSDPTIIYGKAINKENITKKDILTPTPYNTYTVPALPIGPISNPGRESLLAVIHPAESDYLYFVSRNNGTHVFSKNFQDHQKAVTQFQLDPKAREGHSWRELSAQKAALKAGGVTAPPSSKTMTATDKNR